MSLAEKDLRYKREWEKKGPIYVPRYDRIPIRNPHRPRTIPVPSTLITFGVHASAAFTSASSGCTTAARNTTGVSLIVANVVVYTLGTGLSFTDSASNSWTQLTSQTAVANMSSTLFYVASPTTNASHTFSLSGTNLFGVIVILTFSGTKATSPFDVQNGANDATAALTSIATGSVTPSENNEVIVTGIGWGTVATASETINSSFASPVDIIRYSSGVRWGATASYKIKTDSIAENPTWSWTNAAVVATTIATFKVVPSGAKLFRQPSLSGLGSGGPFFHNPLN